MADQPPADDAGQGVQEQQIDPLARLLMLQTQAAAATNAVNAQIAAMLENAPQARLIAIEQTTLNNRNTLAQLRADHEILQGTVKQASAHSHNESARGFNRFHARDLRPLRNLLTNELPRAQGALMAQPTSTQQIREMRHDAMTALLDGLGIPHEANINAGRARELLFQHYGLEDFPAP